MTAERLDLASLRRTARVLGIIGILVVVGSWVLAGVFPLWAVTGGGTVPTGLFAGVVGVLTYGVPVIGAVMIVFWIGVAIWSRSSAPVGEVADADV